MADAERKLQVKQTKTAQESARIATAKVEGALEKLSLLKGTQPHVDDDRIFPMTFAPIVIEENGRRLVRLARYHCRPVGKLASIDRQFPGLYNARRDNIEKFRRGQFGNTHAVILVRSFYETVQRAVRTAFLHLVPRPPDVMLMACLYSEWIGPDGARLLSFAAVTDEPPPEVAASGHDRMIINLKPEHVGTSLAPAGRSDAELQALLEDRQRPYYEYEVEAA